MKIQRNLNGKDLLDGKVLDGAELTRIDCRKDQGKMRVELVISVDEVVLARSEKMEKAIERCF